MSNMVKIRDPDGGTWTFTLDGDGCGPTDDRQLSIRFATRREGVLVSETVPLRMLRRALRKLVTGASDDEEGL